jgi:CHAT domain-containing protein
VYTRVADTLLVWSVSDAAVRVARTRIDGSRLDGLIAKSRAALELRSPESVVRPMLAELFELLVSPVSDRLGAPGRPLVIVADGELAAVPFAALYDADRRRYLIEDRQLRFSASLREAGPPPAARPRAHGAGMVIIADPAFEAPLHPELSRLPGAAEEASTLGTLYRDHTTLVGAAAGRAAVTAALQRAAILHYAGHAVFDEDRPERSYLVLAGGAAAHLSATDIALLPLGNVRLVALSACQTVGAQRDAVGGLAGLAGAFRAAGVGGVVGSAWRVDDALTRPLMVEFHRSYAASGNGPAALRDAQLRLLRSPTAALRAPAAWASFRYVGF